MGVPPLPSDRPTSGDAVAWLCGTCEATSQLLTETCVPRSVSTETDTTHTQRGEQVSTITEDYASEQEMQLARLAEVRRILAATPTPRPSEES